ncbi:MAG: leishmanolysin-related zinc metalloendopeptidase [Gemmatimonadales bacterium]
MRKLATTAAVIALSVAGCSRAADVPVAVPFSIDVVAGNNQLGTVGQPAPIVPSVIVRDQRGSAMAGAAISVAVTGGGTLTGTPAVTAASGPTLLGTWTLGKAPGGNLLTVTAGTATAGILATGLTGVPAKLVLQSGGVGLGGTVGFPTSTNIVIQVRDLLDNPVPGFTPQVTASDGGAALLLSPISDSNGLVTIIRWQMGSRAGTQTLTIDVGNGATPLVISGTARPGPVAAVAPANALPLSALWGTPTPPLAAIVSDLFGNRVAGATVSFGVRTGGGSISGATSAVSDPNGVATGGRWVLGPTFAQQTAAATVGGMGTLFTAQAASGYHVTTRFVGTVDADLQARVLRAVDRVRGAVVGHVGDVDVSGLDVGTLCGLTGVTPITETIHDLIIYVQIAPIDGVNGVFAQTVPCVVRSDNQLPTVSVVTIDAADSAFLIANGLFDGVVLHEVIHALGFGSDWLTFAGLLSGVGTADPRFLGTAATAAFVAAGGSSAPGVPAENVGAPAIVNQHWRTSSFGDELMTGSFSVGQLRPFSAITIQSLGDIGYVTNPAAADNFVFSGPALIRIPSGTPRAWMLDGPGGGERVLAPRATIDARGLVRARP